MLGVPLKANIRKVEDGKCKYYIIDVVAPVAFKIHFGESAAKTTTNVRKESLYE
jgi:hypothetical protein